MTTTSPNSSPFVMVFQLRAGTNLDGSGKQSPQYTTHNANLQTVPAWIISVSHSLSDLTSDPHLQHQHFLSVTSICHIQLPILSLKSTFFYCLSLFPALYLHKILHPSSTAWWKKKKQTSLTFLGFGKNPSLNYFTCDFIVQTDRQKTIQTLLKQR